MGVARAALWLLALVALCSALLSPHQFIQTQTPEKVA